MNRPRVAIASFGVDEFAMLHAVCEASGLTPAVYLYSRAMRPARPAESYAAPTIAELVAAIPPGMDLLLPGTAREFAGVFSGYGLDLLVVYGFNWRIPAEARNALRLGALNVHTSLLPRYRGPAPIIAAIRNGDRSIGVTVHRMEDDFDTGPILAQVGGLPLVEDVTFDGLLSLLRPAVSEALSAAIPRVLMNEPGEPQPVDGASYAGFLEPEFARVDWSRTAAEVHHQVRVFRYLGVDDAPVGVVHGRSVILRHTRLEPGVGTRVECRDGPIWIVESAPARSDANC